MTTDLYSQALAELHGHADAVDALDRIKAARGQMASTDARAAQRQIIDDAITSVIDKGADLPDDLGARLVASEQADAEQRLVVQVVDMIEDEARDRIRQATLYPDAALEFLAGQLDDLLDQVRDADVVCGPTVTSADAALAADDPKIAEAYRTISGAPDRYEEIRMAQWRLLIAPYDRDIDNTPMLNKVARAGLFRNALEFDPRLREQIDPDAGAKNAQGAYLDVPWPAPMIQKGGIAQEIMPTSAPVDYVRWIAAGGEAEAWVPTVAEMEARLTEIEREIRASRPKSDRAHGWSPL